MSEKPDGTGEPRDAYGLSPEPDAPATPQPASGFVPPTFAAPRRWQPIIVHDHDNARKRNLLLLALLLLGISVMPTWSEKDGFELSSFTTLWDREASWMERVMRAGPLAAGAAAGIVALGVDGVAGSYVMMAVGAAFLSLLIGLIGSTFRGMVALLPSLHAGGAAGAIRWMVMSVLGMLAGWALLYGAQRSRYFRPTSREGYWLGLLGGLLYVGLGAWLILPGLFDKSGAAETEWNATAIPLAALALTALLAPVLSAILSAVNTPRRASDGMAHIGWLLMCLAALSVFAIFSIMVWQSTKAQVTLMQAMQSKLAPGAAAPTDGKMWYGAIVGLLQGTIAPILIGLCVAFGLADLIVRLPVRRTEVW